MRRLSLGRARINSTLPSLPRRFNFQLFWAPGDASGRIETTDHWTANGASVVDPPTGSLPLVLTPELTAKTQIFPAAGYRQRDTGSIGGQNSIGYYYSSTPAGVNIDGYDLRITSAYVNPAVLNSGYTVGGSIRCVRP